MHFFDNEDAFAGPINDYEGHHRFFRDAAAASVWLEATPIYMYWRPAAARIAEYNPHMKLILILRDPVERAISYWETAFSRGAGPEVFERALERERARQTREPGQQNRTQSYPGRGFYGRQVERLLEAFPRRQLLFLKREDLLLRHEETLDAACRFPGLAEFSPYPERTMVYPTVKKANLPAVSAAAREALRSLPRATFVWDGQPCGWAAERLAVVGSTTRRTRKVSKPSVWSLAS